MSTSCSHQAAPLKVLFFGATGNIGFQMLRQGLLTPKYAKHFEVTLGCRAATLKTEDAVKKGKLDQLKAQGAVLAELDFEQLSHVQLVSEIKKYDILVALTSYGTTLEKSLDLLSAAKEAGNLKLFIPSEFGSLYDQLDTPTPIASIDQKLKFTEALVKSGVPYARIHTGILYEYFFGPFGSIISAPRIIAAPGSMDTKVTIMSEFDAAQLTAEILLNYAAPYVKNQSILLGAECITWGEAAALLEAKTGSVWNKSVKSVADMEAKIAENKAPFMVLMLERWHLVMGKQKGFLWNPKGENSFFAQHHKAQPNWNMHLMTPSEYVQQLKL